MSNTSRQHSLIGSLASLVAPIVTGMALTIGFYILVLRGPLNFPIAYRYFASHPILFVETALFFVGLAALGRKLCDVIWQQSTLTTSLPPVDSKSLDISTECNRLLETLGELPARIQQSYLGQRLIHAIEYVSRKGDADGLNDELKYLADNDSNQQSDSYSLVRIVIWATPMLGFLGTVVGITESLGDLATQKLGGDLQNAMKDLLKGLYVAFDTTALALTLSMLLMFYQFLIEQLETSLLLAINDRVEDELMGRFESSGQSSNPHIGVVQRMAQSVVRSVEQITERQAQIWNSAFNQSQNQWNQVLQSAGGQLQQSLTAALDGTMQRHAERVSQAQQSGLEAAREQWRQWQEVLAANCKTLVNLQGEMTKQAELVHHIVHSTGEIMQLEQALNNNLRSLAGAKNFEDTVMSLAAAIHLLNTRLDPTQVPRVESRSRGRAA